MALSKSVSQLVNKATPALNDLLYLSDASTTPPTDKNITVVQLQTIVGNTEWHLTGNAGMIDGTNFIGTTDNIPLSFKVNNQKAGRIDNTLNNTFFGYQAGNVTTGAQNTGIGMNALISNIGGAFNTAIGRNSLFSNTTASQNTAIGNGAMSLKTTGGENVAVGINALSTNTTGVQNTAIGSNALTGNGPTGDGNIALGYYAGAYETGSNSLYLHNGLGVTNLATGKTNSLFYGTMNATAATQMLRINAGHINLPIVLTNGSFANNAAALAGGLASGDLYYTDTAGEYIIKIAH